MQRLEVSGAVRLIYKLLGIKWLIHARSNCKLSYKTSIASKIEGFTTECALVLAQGGSVDTYVSFVFPSLLSFQLSFLLQGVQLKSGP
jgi:hypothetical protein